MKILTILGTRPEIIRLSRVIPRLDAALGRANHCLVHTGQNHSPLLYMQFFYDLNLRHPDVQLKMEGTFGEQVGAILPQVERTLLDFRPDRLLVLGDTNSSLAAIVAARLLIPVYHMEAGNRPFSSRSPEEVNRRLIDHASTVLLPYTERSRQNLLAEGIHSSRIFVTGNPIWEVMRCYDYKKRIDDSDIMKRLSLKVGSYFLVTLHRAENIDSSDRLADFLSAFNTLAREYDYPVIISTHPHLRQRLDQNQFPAGLDPRLHFLPPFPFFDFIALEKSAFCVLSDSGTVQEECAINGTSSVILRDHTERPETIESGATVLSSSDPSHIVSLVKTTTSMPVKWRAPADYKRTDVSETVVRILLSHLETR
jgi:UDP-N-acetylglucosamine 2-epimerase (non-hydrolysing)